MPVAGLAPAGAGFPALWRARRSKVRADNFCGTGFESEVRRLTKSPYRYPPRAARRLLPGPKRQRSFRTNRGQHNAVSPARAGLTGAWILFAAFQAIESSC